MTADTKWRLPFRVATLSHPCPQTATSLFLIIDFGEREDEQEQGAGALAGRLALEAKRHSNSRGARPSSSSYSESFLLLHNHALLPGSIIATLMALRLPHGGQREFSSLSSRLKCSPSPSSPVSSTL